MNPLQQMHDAIRSAYPKPRIVVIGDALIDRWKRGRFESCQEGCPKFVQNHPTVETPGGAANAHSCLHPWGVLTELVAVPIECRSVKTRLLGENNEVRLRYDADVWTYADDWMVMEATKAAQRADGVLLSDYDKGLLTPRLIGVIRGICRNRGIPCVADCKREPEVYEGCIRKCNNDYFLKYKDELSKLWGEQFLVVTNGPANPVVWDGKSYPPEPELPSVGVVNHVGAGDCFAAHLTLALACGLKLLDAARLAHAAGTVYVQLQPGTNLQFMELYSALKTFCSD